MCMSKGWKWPTITTNMTPFSIVRYFLHRDHLYIKNEFAIRNWIAEPLRDGDMEQTTKKSFVLKCSRSDSMKEVEEATGQKLPGLTQILHYFRATRQYENPRQLLQCANKCPKCDWTARKPPHLQPALAGWRCGAADKQLQKWRPDKAKNRLLEIVFCA